MSIWKSLLVLPLGASMACADLAASAKERVADGPNAEPAVIDGVRWETSLRDAKVRAEKENKPILLLQLFGRLDDEFC